MTDADRTRFMRTVQVLAETFLVDVSELRLHAYWEVLKAYDVDDVCGVGKELLEGDWFPKPAEWIAAMGTRSRQALERTALPPAPVEVTERTHTFTISVGDFTQTYTMPVVVDQTVCADCDDTGWRSRECPGDTGLCGRYHPHGPHRSDLPCPCRSHNVIYLRNHQPPEGKTRKPA